MGGATPPITDFLFTTFRLRPQQQLPRVQAVSPQPCCHAVSPSPAVSEPRSFSGLWTLHLHLGWTSCCLPPFWWRCGQRTRSLPPRHPWLRWRPCHQHTSLRPSRGHHQSNCQGWVIVFFRLQLAPEQGERRKRLIFPVTWIWGLPGIMFHLLEDQLNPSSYVSCTLRRTSPALVHISWRCSQAYTASCHAATCGCHAVYSSTTCACHDVPCSCHSANHLLTLPQLHQLHNLQLPRNNLLSRLWFLYRRLVLPRPHSSATFHMVVLWTPFATATITSPAVRLFICSVTTTGSAVSLLICSVTTAGSAFGLLICSVAFAGPRTVL